MKRGAKILCACGAVAAAVLLCGLAYFGRDSRPTVTVQLPANRDAGYTWVCSVKPSGSFVTLSNDYRPENTDDPDGGGVETFVLQSRRQGDSTVTFTCVDAKTGTVDSTATYGFNTEGSTITREHVSTEISAHLMEPWQTDKPETQAA